MFYRRSRFPSLWREMDRLQKEMNHLVGEVYPSRLRRAPSFPAMNIWTSDETAIVTAEIPGVNPEEINVSVVGETLTLSGSRSPDELEEGARYHRQERGYGNFTRSIRLPFMVNADMVEASFKNGVLQISLPRIEEDKPKKIVVKSG